MKIGLIGCGSMGRTHTYCVKNIPFFYRDADFTPEIYGVCAAHAESAGSFAEKYGIGFYTDSEDELINDKNVDIIDICTPNMYHFETIKKAIAAGKAIYCEKPLCVTASQAREVARLAREKNITAGIVFNNRFYAATMRAKQLANEGRLGKILRFHAQYLHSSATEPTKKAGWKQNREICGGGVLFDLGSHITDLVYYLCGEFDEVMGKSQIAYPIRTGIDGQEWKTNADEAFYMCAKLRCGAIGTIEASKICAGENDGLSFEIGGTLGSIKFSLENPDYLYFYDSKDKAADLGGERGFKKIECGGRYAFPGGTFPSPKAPIGWLRGHIGSMYSFLDAYNNGRSASPSFDDASHIQSVLEAAYLSDSSGKWEKVK